MLTLAASMFVTIDLISPPEVISLTLLAIDDRSRIQSVGVSPVNTVESSGSASPEPSSRRR